MLLRKFMSLLGVGSAEIDLILPKDTYHAGDIINAFFLIKGGTIDQKTKQINCDFIMKDLLTGGESVIGTTTVLTSKLIQSEASNQIAFTFKLPEDLAISSEERSYRFKTWLTFNEGVESKDQDIIQIISQNS
jgi:sporulation-control protein